MLELYANARWLYRSGKLLAALECAQTYHAGLDAYRQFTNCIQILPIAQQSGRNETEKLRNGIKTATEYRLSKLVKFSDYIAAAQRQSVWRLVPLAAALIAENTAQAADDFVAALTVFRSSAAANDEQAKVTIECTSACIRFIFACSDSRDH